MQRLLEIEKNDSKISRVYFISLILLLISYFIILYNNAKLNDDQKSVTHTYEVITTLQSLHGAIKDAESGMRGYLITGNKNFLNPYDIALPKIDSVTKKLNYLINDNSTQIKNLETLKILTQERLALLVKNKTLFEQQNNVLTDSVRHLLPTNLQKMNEIRLQAQLMKEIELDLLSKRKTKVDELNKILITITFISLLLALAIFSFGFITYRKEYKSKKEALNEIVDYQDKLQSQVEELNSANNELIRIRSLEKFSATGRIARQIAHEVRNPLTNINLATNQLKEDLKISNEDDLYLFDMISRNSNRINQLISDLLSSTKFAELHFEENNIVEILEEALLLAKDRIELNKIKVVKNFQFNNKIQVDKEKLKIAFLNLIINAIEAMEKNTINPTLTINTTCKNDDVTISISDNGIGLDEESLSKIFEPYFTSKHKGNGLGLTNTQNVILNHKGEIEVKSNLNVGTTFMVTLKTHQ